MSALAIQSRYLDGAPVSFGEAINAALRNAFTYRGRASRSAYWWFYLAITLAYVAIWLIAVLLTATTSTTAAGLIIGLLSLALIYPWPGRVRPDRPPPPRHRQIRLVVPDRRRTVLGRHHSVRHPGR
jgi:hypothetical protein